MRKLACISQRLAAARAQWPAMTALRLIRVLNVLQEYACALEPARALPSRPLRPLASRPVEKCRLAPFVLLGALSVLGCDVLGGLPGGVGGGSASTPTVVFVGNATAESLPAEEAAAWAWLQDRDEFRVAYVQLADLAGTSLPRDAVLWWHYAEHESLPSAAVRPATLAAVRRHLLSGGSALLTLVAASWVVPLEIETSPPNLVSAGARQLDEDAQLGGLQSRLGHPLLQRFYGGAFTSGTPPARAAVAVYRGDSWPAGGRVWAVHKNENLVDPSYKVGIEYLDAVSGEGNVVTLGAHCYFADNDNIERVHLEQLVSDALAYLLVLSGNPPFPGEATPETGGPPDPALKPSGRGSDAAASPRPGPLPPVLDGTPRYWLPEAPDELIESIPPTAMPEPADPGTVINAVEGQRSGAEMTSYPGEEISFTLAGTRLAAYGSQLGRIDELWAHPARILRGLRFGIVRPERGVTWLDEGTGQHTFRARPEGIEISYHDGDVEVSVHMTVDRRYPALVALVTVRGPAAVEIIATWEMDRAAAWPGGEQLFGPLAIGWDEGAAATLWRDMDGEFVAMAGFGPQTREHIIGYRPAEHLGEQGLTIPEAPETDSGIEPGGAADTAVEPSTGRDAAGGDDAGTTTETAAEQSDADLAIRRVAVQAHLEPGRPALLPFVVVAGNPDVVDVASVFAELIADPGRPWIDSAAYYREFLENGSMDLLLGDSDLQNAFKWAKVGIEALRTDARGVGTGIYSGHGPRSSADAWIARSNAFGGSGALWAAMAADAYGDRGLSADTLRMIARYQASDGRIPATVSPSWEMLYGPDLDTPLFVIAVGNHIRTWGDRQLLDDLWPAVELALGFGTATDVDGDGLMEGRGRLDRWGDDDEITTTIQLAGLWGAALEAAAEMAGWRGDVQQATSWQEQAGAVRAGLNQELQFWNPSRRGFNVAKRSDGTFVDTRTILPAIPALFRLLDAGSAGAALDSFAASELSSDWGVALTSNAPPEIPDDGVVLTDATPAGAPLIAADLVSPIFTGWAALAEYAYQRDVAGFSHAAANLRLLEHGNLGYATGALSRSDFSYASAVDHAAASQALSILPVTWGMLGIRPNAMADPQTLEVMPQLPAGWPRVVADPVRMGNSEFRVMVRRNTGQTQFLITRLRGTDPVHLRLGARVPIDVAIGLDPNLVGATIVGEEIIETTAIDRSSAVVAEMTGSSATITFNHGEYPRLAPPDISLQPGGTSVGLRVIRTRYAGGLLQLGLEGLPGRTYTLRLATPWSVSQVTGVPDPSIHPPEPGWATIEIVIPGSGPRYRPINLDVSFER